MKTLLDKVAGHEALFQKASLPILNLMNEFNVENVNITFIGNNVSIKLKSTTAETATVSPAGNGE